jgi:hypothetical protein
MRAVTNSSAKSSAASTMVWRRGCSWTHVEEIYPVSIYDGQALNVTTSSYADRVGFGYLAGAELMPDIHTLIPLTEACLAELESALGASATYIVQSRPAEQLSRPVDQAL